MTENHPIQHLWDDAIRIGVSHDPIRVPGRILDLIWKPISASFVPTFLCNHHGWHGFGWDCPGRAALRAGFARAILSREWRGYRLDRSVSFPVPQAAGMAARWNYRAEMSGRDADTGREQ